MKESWKKRIRANVKKEADKLMEKNLNKITKLRLQQRLEYNFIKNWEESFDYERLFSTGLAPSSKKIEEMMYEEFDRLSKATVTNRNTGRRTNMSTKNALKTEKLIQNQKDQIQLIVNLENEEAKYLDYVAERDTGKDKKRSFVLDLSTTLYPDRAHLKAKRNISQDIRNDYKRGITLFEDRVTNHMDLPSEISDYIKMRASKMSITEYTRHIYNPNAVAFFAPVYGYKEHGNFVSEDGLKSYLELVLNINSDNSPEANYIKTMWLGKQDNGRGTMEDFHKKNKK